LDRRQPGKKHTSGSELANPQNCKKYDRIGVVGFAERTSVSCHIALTDLRLALVNRPLRRILCDKNVCHEDAEVDDVVSKE